MTKPTLKNRGKDSSLGPCGSPTGESGSPEGGRTEKPHIDYGAEIEAGEDSGGCWKNSDNVKHWNYVFQEPSVDAVGRTTINFNTFSRVEGGGRGNGQSSGGFRLVQVGNLQFRPPRFLIKDYVEADSLGLVFGDPGCGKSFLALDMGCSIASGTEFHGCTVTEAAPVIYVAGEGQNGIRRRISAWEIARNVDLSEAPLFVSTMPAALCDKHQIVEVIRAVDEVASHYRAPALVIFDTLARNFGPGDENNTSDMGNFIQAADLIRSRYNSSVLIIHHTGHADKSRARGAMALKGALDFEFMLEKDQADRVRITSKKMKDARLPEAMAFRLAPVELGICDDAGEQVTSAILSWIEYESSASNAKSGRGKWETLAEEKLSELLKEKRSTLELAGRDPDDARVSVNDWRRRCTDAGMDKRRFSEIKSSAKEKGIAMVDNGIVTPL